MAFMFIDHFPPDEQGNYCVPQISPEALLPYTPTIPLGDAMYIWWLINKVRYTYSWYFQQSFEGITTTVVGEGSVLMSGGLDTMSEKICPQTIYYTCSQNVIYSNTEPGETVEANDQVILSIDSRPSRCRVNDDMLYIPNVSLTICPGRYSCEYLTWNTVEDNYGDAGVVDFFGLYQLPLANTIPGDGISWAVSISLSVESTSEAV